MPIHHQGVNERYEIQIGMDNAAFSEVPGDELARILRGLADRLDGQDDVGEIVRLMDVNGNRVGYASPQAGLSTGVWV